jgi:hypothetical protein
MKGNTISANVLNENATNWLTKMHDVLRVKEYGKGSVRNYMQEMTLLFKYYNHKTVEEINQGDIEQYILFIKKLYETTWVSHSSDLSGYYK